MAFIIKPAAESGLGNAILHPGGELPLRIEGIAPGSYTVGRVDWAPEPVLVAAPATVPGMPRDLTFGEVGVDRLTLTWEPPESDGGAPVLSYQVAARIAGSTQELPWQEGASPQTFVDLAPDTAYEFRVRARNSVGPGEWSKGWSRQVTAAMPTEDAPMVAGERVGYLATRDEGVAGDWFVAPGGSDSAAGTLAAPFATIGRAMRAASGGDVIRLRGGTYRETVDFTGKGGSPGARTTVARYGSEQAVISGFEVLSGWTACGAGDEDVVGPNYAEIYKVTIPTSALPAGGGRVANLYEGRTKLNLAALKVPFPFRPDTDQYTGDWLSADSIGKDGSGNIVSYTLAGLSERFTEAQIENAVIRMYVYPNNDAEMAVAGFDDMTDTITVSDASLKQEGSSTRFCLVNLLPAMKPGQWGYVTAGSDTTFYLWPLDAAHLAGGVYYSARSRVVYFNEEVHCEIRGLICEGTTSRWYNGQSTAGISVNTSVGASGREGLVIENCLSRNVFTTTNGTVLRLGGTNNRIENYEIENAPGCFGIWSVGSNSIIDKCLIRGTDRSAIRIYGGHDTRITRNLCIDCGNGSHSNKGNVYFGGYNYLWWHNIWHGCDGYFTWQEASGIHLGFSWVPGASVAIRDQNRNGGYSHATTNQQNETAYILNNITPPNAGYSGGASLLLGYDYEPYVRYDVRNNVLLGFGSSWPDAVDGWSNNLYPSGSRRDPSDTLISIGDVWEDISIGDIAIKATSPSNSAEGADLTGIVAALRSAGFDYEGFDLDLAGESFDLDAPPVGPYLPGSTPVALPPVWLKQPVVSGTPEPGRTLTVGNGELVGYPYPTKSYQWIRSDDDFITHSNITGETAATYQVDEGDVGYKVGCVVTAGGEAATTVAVDAEVAEAYPIAAPRVINTTLFPGTGKTLLRSETDGFTCDGTGLLVVVGIRNNAGGRDDYRVTVGAPGRDFGTGAALDEVDGFVHRWGVFGHAFFIPRPPAGDVTVQVEGTRAEVSSAQVVVLDVAGAGAAAFGGKTGGTSVTGLTSSVTTQAGNGYVIWMLARIGGSGAGAVGVDYGGSVLFDAGTSVSGDYGMWLSLFAEAAPQPGKKSAKTTFVTASASMGGIALAPQ